MEKDGKKLKLFINLAEDHPIWQLGEKARANTVREILDRHYVEVLPTKQEIQQLSARIDLLSTKLDLLEEVYYTIQQINHTLGLNKLNQHLIVREEAFPHKKEKADPPLVSTSDGKKINENSGENKITFDFDAFLDLG